MLRLFFAVQPGAEQAAALVRQVAPLVARLEAQPVAPANLHATLCFIGAVPDERLPLLEEAIRRVRGGRATLQFDSLEYWRKPQVLCATAGDDSLSAPLRVLAQQLGVVAGEAGFTPDLKPFRAHLTLARKVRGASAARCEWPMALTPQVQVRCERFVLMRSDRGPSGSAYSVVKSWPLYENVRL
ncbi:MAG TPA: RNA 2',3'-cyclic phosphodiesterase [Steroidobacteraceae bacterium]|nr:RNA 2',3'-cyclic phosphodiesterase [Steroidobacteraceae bacterium]